MLENANVVLLPRDCAMTTNLGHAIVRTAVSSIAGLLEDSKCLSNYYRRCREVSLVVGM